MKIELKQNSYQVVALDLADKGDVMDLITIVTKSALPVEVVILARKNSLEDLPPASPSGTVEEEVPF